MMATQAVKRSGNLKAVATLFGHNCHACGVTVGPPPAPPGQALALARSRQRKDGLRPRQGPAYCGTPSLRLGPGRARSPVRCVV